MHELVKYFEGLHLEAYQDTASIWTIGYGHTKGVKEGMKITKDEADKFFDEDIKDAEDRVLRAVPSIALSQSEFQALVSLAYNLRSFEQLASYLPDRDKFKKKMLLYARDVKGNPLKGLKIRRICERLLFENKDWRPALELQKQSMANILKKEEQLFV
jgi:lysozyme